MDKARESCIKGELHIDPDTVDLEGETQALVGGKFRLSLGSCMFGWTEPASVKRGVGSPFT